MNCLEFEGQVEILARGTLADARTRAAAETHSESCEGCAARLADERALSVGLRALAAGMKTAEAPARVETALLSAFRARTASVHAEQSSDAAAASNVVPMSGQAPTRRLSWAKTFAVASMAAAASLALFVLVRPGVDAPAGPRESAARAQEDMIEPPNTNGGPPASVAARSDESVGSAPVEVVRDATPRAGHTPRPRATNISYTNKGGRLARPAQAAEEVATEFIPLMQAGPYTQAEEGHLVRVELPRSALASFGLPVNAEAPAGRVKADVLLGQDGVARAIRFVR
ncbi:MAG: hypothetical protein ABW208_24980 [Pyrinomonadaceae bacterium]